MVPVRCLAPLGPLSSSFARSKSMSMRLGSIPRSASVIIMYLFKIMYIMQPSMNISRRAACVIAGCIFLSCTASLGEAGRCCLNVQPPVRQCTLGPNRLITARNMHFLQPICALLGRLSKFHQIKLGRDKMHSLVSTSTFNPPRLRA